MDLLFRPEMCEKWPDTIRDEECYVYEDQYDLERLTQAAAILMAKEDKEPEQESNDVVTLQQQLQRNDTKLQLLAELGNSLYRLCNDLTSKNAEHESQIHGLTDEVSQLRFSNSSLTELVVKLEIQLSDLDSEVEIKENEKQSKNDSALSDSLLQDTVDEVERENTLLQIQLAELRAQLESQEKEMIIERQKLKKHLSLLQAALDCKEMDLADAKKRERKLKQEKEELNERLLAHETETAGLREQLMKSNVDLQRFKSLYDKAVADNAECRRILRDKKRQLAAIQEISTKKRFIRHIQNPSAPYVDPDSFTCETDKLLREQHRGTYLDLSTSGYYSDLSITWPHDTSSISCDDMSIGTVESDTVDGNTTDGIAPLSYRLALGQPGRPGSLDLDVALSRLSQIHHWYHRPTAYLDLTMAAAAGTIRLSRSQTDFGSHHAKDEASLSHELSDAMSLAASDSDSSSSAICHSLPSFNQFQRKSCEGLNLLWGFPRSQKSGILLRGSEIQDLFEEVEYSINDVEVDDVDLRSDAVMDCPTGFSVTDAREPGAGKVLVKPSDITADARPDDSVYDKASEMLPIRQSNVVKFINGSNGHWKDDGLSGTVLKRSHLTSHDPLVQLGDTFDLSSKAQDPENCIVS